jgi:hypothetical protein
MKHALAFASVLAFLAVSSIPTVLADPLPHPPRLVTIAPENVFVPPGFDSNDNAQITITGSYPNTCYKSAPASVTVDEQNKRIVLRNQSYLRTSCWCLQMLVPYVQTVDIGVLKAGSYSILVEQSTGELSKQTDLSVAVSANAGPDDDLYAHVQEVRLDSSNSAGAKTLTLSGILTSSCMRIQEIKVAYHSSRVIEIRPLVSVQNQPDCASARIPFEERVVLTPSWQGTGLIHVRTLNGQSINRVAEF